MDAGTSKQHRNYRKKSDFRREDNELSLEKSEMSVGHPGGDVQQAAGNTGPEL